MIKQEFMGYLNNRPAIAILEVNKHYSDQWEINFELKWDEQHAITNKLNQGVLWKYKGPLAASQEDALRFGREWLSNQGFYYNKDTQ